MKPLCLSFIPLLFLSILSPFSCLGTEPFIGTVDGIVVNVSDGDRITVNNNGTELHVRLFGIDAPEITKVQRNEPWLSRPGQPFAGRAFMALSNKVLHKHVRLEIVRIDRRGRVVAGVFLENRNINLEMVAEGLAWASRKSRKQPEGADYVLAEEKARSGKVGLWSHDSQVPPWEFRKLRNIENIESW